MATNDPYYYSRDIMARQAQARALGQSKGFTPDELSGIIKGNFEAQQEKEVTQRKLALDTRNQALQESRAVNEAKQAKNASIGQTLYGGTSLALQAHKQGVFGGGTGTTATATNSTTAPISTGAVAMSPSSLSTGADLANITNEARLATMTGEQVAATAGEKAVSSAVSGSLAGAAGWAGVGSMVGSTLVHGKYSKAAGVAGATIAGATYGSVVPGVGTAVGAIAGLVVGSLQSIFG